MNAVLLNEVARNKLYILCGIPFSGKTTLAKELTKRFAYTHIDLDVIKCELYGIDIKDESLKQSDWDIIYARMYNEIDRELKDGHSVVHDTGNFTIYERSLIQNIARKLHVPFVTIYVDTPIEAARARLHTNRMTNSRFNITDEAFMEAVNEMEPPAADENPCIFNSTNESVEEFIAKNFT